MKRRQSSRNRAIQALELEQRDGLSWPTLRDSWRGRSPAEIETAHNRAAQLLAGGWGSVVWADQPQVGESQQLVLDMSKGVWVASTLRGRPSADLD